MQCPVDGTVLVMADKSGVEIDYCPTCRGVWLDRGELDKIVSRMAAEAGPPVALQEPASPRRSEPPRGDDRDHRRSRDDDDDDRHRGAPRKRRESFLSDLFDF